MLAHCNEVLETAMGKNFPKRIFIGRILSPFMKAKFLSESEFPKNTPTDGIYLIADKRQFEKEKARSIQLINTFYEGGSSKCTTHPHPFFGKFTPEQWAIYEWKHFDHHLRQFGV